MEVTVCIGTYGTDEWFHLAHERAIASTTKPTVHVHGHELHSARNAALEQVETEWVCFLDADDELAPDYFDHMAQGSADVRAPWVSYIAGGRNRQPYLPRVSGHKHEGDCHADCLPDGNWLVIGSVARTDLIRKVGGFRAYPVYEDWDLWLRCHLAGASFEAIPHAIYRAHYRPDSRNKTNRRISVATHHAIAKDNGITA